MKDNQINIETNKLCIGTVQFGLDYGIANQKGQVSFKESKSILKFAKESGIHCLDTAIAYGESEKILGEIGVKDWQIISKLPALPDNSIYDWTRQSIAESLKRLKINNLYAILLHHPQDLFSIHGDRLYQALIQLKSDKLIKKIGISIYDPLELEKLTHDFDFDIIQSPMNFFDRRLLETGWLKKLHKKGIEIHIRSIFLQGLLLMSEKERSAKFDKWRSLWDKWHCWLLDANLSPLQACLGFINQFSNIDKLIVGVDNVIHLEEILLALQTDIIQYPDELQSDDINLINPSRWKSL
ncbi:aldo/keto reductase [Leptospira alstonii]|uniref:aldo/keto reductase n=1 Tax=Leptospira alstonii TaxID=28452 RepID=UPI000773DAE2|nr:aldo/keto reductase [Leptospira alstonii]